MSVHDFRGFLAVAEQQGKLKRVAQTVDRLWEPACLAKWVFQALPDDDRFGLMFENVEGSQIPLVTGALGASVHTYALALGVDPENLNEVWSKALIEPQQPRMIENALCQEVVLRGNDVRLSDLPIPVWTPGKDAGPYITTITVCRRHDTGEQNMGVYRTLVRDDKSVIVNLMPGRQGHAYAQTYLDQKKPAPIAWVVGTEPVVHLASVANLPIGVDEISVAGGLKREPVDVVKAKTSDLFVPANAEIIIEGEVLPGETAIEGPFGESAGYMSGAGPRCVARITAITHRKDPIYYGYTSQIPPSESTVIQSLSNAPLVLKTLRHDLGEKTVRDVFIDLTFGGGAAHGIVSMKPLSPGHATRIGRMVAATTTLKRITIVDEDIDIRDPTDMNWAMNSHYDPARDTVIIPDVFRPLDHSILPDFNGNKMGGQLIIDATRTVDPGELSLPSRELMERALDVWHDAQLPGFRIPKRLKNRLEHS